MVFLQDQRGPRGLKLSKLDGDPDLVQAREKVLEEKKQKKLMLYNQRKRKSDDDINKLFQKGDFFYFMRVKMML